MPLPNWLPGVLTEDWQRGGFGLYVHWPFCEAKCPYCDFNSHVVAKVDQRRWAKALAKEIRRMAVLCPDQILGSVFFGGGTPSLMDPETVAYVLDAARAGWRWENDVEVTLEANPRSVEAARFADYAAAGVNRVSLGVQSLRDDDLRRLGRLHTAAEARAAFDVARSHFDRVSFDLIYARQDQTLALWQAELAEALAMAADHLSLYQLTIEPGTAFWERQNVGGLKGLPDEPLAADMFEMTQDLCGAVGFPAYEISNHARDGAKARHNLVYWRYGDYAGVGPGAHGRLTCDGQKFASAGWEAPGKWLAAVEAGNGDEVWQPIKQQDAIEERIMMGLRLAEGLYVGDLSWSDAQLASLEHMQTDRLIWRETDRIGTTPAGRLVLNAIISELFA